MIEKIKALIRSEEFTRFFRFCVTGVLNTGVDVLTYALLVQVFSVSVFIGQIMGQAVGTLNSYVINRSWTFRTKNKFFSAELVKFICVAAVTCLISLMVMAFLEANFSLHKLILKIPVTAVTIVVNFLLSRLWVFKGAGTRTDDDQTQN